MECTKSTGKRLQRGFFGLLLFYPREFLEQMIIGRNRLEVEFIPGIAEKVEPYLTVNNKTRNSNHLCWMIIYGIAQSKTSRRRSSDLIIKVKWASYQFLLDADGCFFRKYKNGLRYTRLSFKSLFIESLFIEFSVVIFFFLTPSPRYPLIHPQTQLSSGCYVRAFISVSNKLLTIYLWEFNKPYQTVRHLRAFFLAHPFASRIYFSICSLFYRLSLDARSNGINSCN